MATAAPADTAPTAYFESTEHGLPRPTNTVTPRYGWLGAHQRDATNTLAGLTLMGVRLYNPTTGRFLSVDPVPGGSCNAYDYTCADPINATDLDGKWISLVIRGIATGCKVGRWCVRSGKWAGRQAWRGTKWAGRQAWGGARWAGGKLRGGATWAGGSVSRWRLKVAIHGPHHNFRRFGRVKHLSFTFYRKGIKGSHRRFQIPFPGWRGRNRAQ